MAQVIDFIRKYADAVLFSYSQILFTQNRWVGLTLLAATMLKPAVGLMGLAAVVLSFPVVRAARFSDELALRGHFGYNPLLVGLALGAFMEPNGTAAGLLLLAVVATVFLQTALESALSYFFNLPILSLPFVIVAFLCLAAMPFLEHAQPVIAAVEFDPAEAPRLPESVALYLRALGAIFFSPEVLTGAVVLAALLLYSRIATLLSILGFAVGWVFLSYVFSLSAPMSRLIVSYNAILTAVALGGIWFVPQRSSFAFAGVGVLLCALLTIATILFMLPLRLPVLILPFNVTMFLTLYAMRQRVRDLAPKSVDFAAGAPEVNLNYYRTRVARFGRRSYIRFALPFSGRWAVTQGYDGRHTHKGLWRHALDFEVRDATGSTHSGSGSDPRDFHCYRLPVFAPADATVIKVVNDVPDNQPGQRNPRDPWGNLVLMQHAIGVYSVCAHLAPGSVEVAEGQWVRQGTRIGLCGNSGRSFRPHLHFQVQGTPRVGAPTMEADFFDCVTEGADAPMLHRSIIPEEDAVVRNIERKEDVAGLFAWPIGTRVRFRYTGFRGRVREEEIVSGIDLYNNLFLESRESGARLYFENMNRQFLVYDYFGPRRSSLYLLYAAAPRVPFDCPHGLKWDDALSRGHFRARWISWLVDFVDPFLPLLGLKLDFTASTDGGGLAVTGRGKVGRQPLATRAVFTVGAGLAEASLEIGGAAAKASLVEVLGEGQ